MICDKFVCDAKIIGVADFIKLSFRFKFTCNYIILGFDDDGICYDFMT